ncbi:MAG: hypothetical protein ACI9EW_002456 [Cellvibrionaceae bacterium]|jgi:hypothetical protein
MSDVITSTSPQGYGLLWAITILSLLLNIGLIAGAMYFLNQTSQQMTAAANLIEQNSVKNFDIPIKIDEIIPIKFTVDYKDEFNVPINTTIPVSTSVKFREVVTIAIKEVIPVDTFVEVSIQLPFPLNQSFPINIPIKTDIPVNLTIEVPLDYDIPISATIPINLDLSIPVETQIPIDEDIAVQLEFPVTVPLEDTDIPSFIDSLAQGLRSAGERLRLR